MIHRTHRRHLGCARFACILHAVLKRSKKNSEKFSAAKTAKKYGEGLGVFRTTDEN